MRDIYFILLSFLFILVSCNYSGHETTMEGEVYTFSSDAGEPGLQTIWVAGDAIGISAYVSGYNTIYSGYINREYRMADTGLFSPSADGDIILHPSAGVSLDFVAYYPYRAGTLDLYMIDLSDQSSQKAVDILYSNNAKNRTRDSEKIEFVFNHILSKIIIYPQPGDGIAAEDLHGMSIAIDSIYREAVLDLRDGSVEAFGTKKSIITNTSATGDMSKAILLPGASDAWLTVKLANQGEYRAKFPDNHIFNAGTISYYNVTISRTGIVLTPVEILDWAGTDELPDKSTAMEIVYKSGDFYPNPTDPGTAIGIVYWVSAASHGREGKIASFYTTESQWGTYEQGSYGTSITNGRVNLNIVSLLDPSLQQFPAFQWCTQLGEGWYLPARYELHIMHELWLANREDINNNILSAGGDIFAADDIYLASSESRSYSTTMAERYSFEDKGWPSIDKAATCRVRAIKQF